jgi:hypothetical protein
VAPTANFCTDPPRRPSTASAAPPSTASSTAPDRTKRPAFDLGHENVKVGAWPSSAWRDFSLRCSSVPVPGRRGVPLTNVSPAAIGPAAGRTVSAGCRKATGYGVIVGSGRGRRAGRCRALGISAGQPILRRSRTYRDEHTGAVISHSTCLRETPDGRFASIPTNLCASELSHSEGLPRLPNESARTGDEGNRRRKVGSIVRNGIHRIHRHI